MGHRLGLFAAAVFFVLAAGCASTHPNGQAVDVYSEPPGAVAITDEQEVRTPGTLYARPGARQMIIVVEKQGFESTTVTLERKGDTFGECLGYGLTEGLIPPGPINLPVLATQLLERLLLIMLNCQASAEGLRPAPVYVTLVPIPPTLVSPRN
jgi:hypothetical protein